MKRSIAMTMLVIPAILSGCESTNAANGGKGGTISPEDAAYLEKFKLFGNIIARDGTLTLDSNEPQTEANGRLLAWWNDVDDVWYVRMTPSATDSGVAIGDAQSNESFVALRATGTTSLDLIGRFDGHTKIEQTLGVPYESGTLTLYKNGTVYTGYVGNKTALRGSVNIGMDGAAGGVLFQSNSTNYRAADIEVVQRPTPYIHLSVDDVFTFLRELSTGSYTSIFEHTFFNDLKELHDEYGTVVSLYIFHGVAGQNWTVSDMSPRFRAEFEQCSSWLKFGFHAADKTVSYVNP